MKRIATSFILGAVALTFTACTEPAPGSGVGQEALTELTPLQQACCTYFPCEDGAPPEFDPEVDQAFANDLKKSAGVLPPPKAEYDGNGTVLNVKFCRPTGQQTFWDDGGGYCTQCELMSCWEVGYGWAVNYLAYDNCYQGVLGNDPRNGAPACRKT